MKKVLVTGGGGFVGMAIVKMLVAAGVHCIVVGRNHYAGLADIGVTCLVGDIRDTEFIIRAGRGVDAVFHTAALAGIWGRWPDYYSTNVVGTQNVIESCRKNNIRSLIYTSTPSVVFNREDIQHGDESLPYATKFLCDYAKSKVIAEKIMLAANDGILTTCALRPHLIWGPGDPHLLPRLLNQGRKRQFKRVGDGTNLVDISYIDNVAHAHILAAENILTSGGCAGNAYFISQGSPVNIWDWINELFSSVNIPVINSSISFPAAYTIGYLLELFYQICHIGKEPKMTRFLAEQLAKSHYFSIAKANRDFGYEPLVSTADGLVKTVKWLKDLEKE